MFPSQGHSLLREHEGAAKQTVEEQRLLSQRPEQPNAALCRNLDVAHRVHAAQAAFCALDAAASSAISDLPDSVAITVVGGGLRRAPTGT